MCAWACVWDTFAQSTCRPIIQGIKTRTWRTRNLLFFREHLLNCECVSLPLKYIPAPDFSSRFQLPGWPDEVPPGIWSEVGSNCDKQNYTQRKNNSLSYTVFFLFIINVIHSDPTLFDTSTHWESVEVALSYFEVTIAVFYMLTYSGKCAVAATRGH